MSSYRNLRKRLSEEKACSRKISYPTRQEADVALEAKREYFRHADDQVVYQCRFCKNFHIGKRLGTR